MQAPRIMPKRPILRAMMSRHQNPQGASRDGYAAEIRHAQSAQPQCPRSTNPVHAIGDEWWEYSADLDAAPWNAGDLHAQVQSLTDHNVAHVGDVQYRQIGAGASNREANRVRASASINGVWYTCTFSRFSSGWGLPVDSWSLVSCVEQAGGGAGAGNRDRPDTFTTPTRHPYYVGPQGLTQPTWQPQQQVDAWGRLYIPTRGPRQF